MRLKFQLFCRDHWEKSKAEARKFVGKWFPYSGNLWGCSSENVAKCYASDRLDELPTHHNILWLLMLKSLILNQPVLPRRKDRSRL